MEWTISLRALGGGGLLAAALIGACVTDSGTGGTPNPDAAAPDAAEDTMQAFDAGLQDALVEGGPALRTFLYAFVSSTEHSGVFPAPAGTTALNGWAGADAFCRDLAEASPAPEVHGLRWVAWLSLAGQNQAWRRLPRENPGSTVLATQYRLRDGVTEVFPKGFRFEVTANGDGGLIFPAPTNSIALDERDNARRINLSVWTGTAQDMSTHPAHCEDWNATFDAGAPVYGLLGTLSSPRLFSHSGDLGAAQCESAHHVYCFEVPEGL